MKRKEVKKIPTLKFYDLRARKAFKTDKYKIVVKKGRRYAVAKAPSGIEAYRIIGKS